MGLLDEVGATYGVDPKLLGTFAKIESGGNPNAVTGSYKGLFQLSPSEFNKYGGGDIFNPADNAKAAAQKLKVESGQFKGTFGRDPSAAELYMIHQQGWGGFQAHAGNPTAPAWQNMYSTAEGRSKGPGWAKQAIWGNIPDDIKKQYPGGVDSLTSQDFLNLWKNKVDHFGGGGNGDYSQATASLAGVPQAGYAGLQPVAASAPQPATTPDTKTALSERLMALVGAMQPNKAETPLQTAPIEMQQPGILRPITFQKKQPTNEDQS